MTATGGRFRALAVAAVVAVCAGFGLVPTAAADTSGVVYLRTVPTMGGVHFDVAGVEVTTADDGTASVPVADLNSAGNQVSLAKHDVRGGVRVWISKLAHGPHVARQSHLSVGLDVSSPVQLGIDSAGTGVAAASVKRVVLHSLAGQTVTVHPQIDATVRLSSLKTRLVRGTLTAQPVTWSVGLISVAPGVALTTNTPRFYPFRHRRWQLHLETVHGTVVVRSVPATPDVEFELGGAIFFTGKNGVATAPIADLNNVRGRLRLAAPTAGAKWVSGMRVSKLPPLKLYERRVLAALDVRRPVDFKFIDTNGLPVSNRNITSVRMTVNNDSVQLVGQELGAPTYLLDTVATRVGKGWQTRSPTYVLRSVRIDGSEAVFDGRQHFTPDDGGTWTIQLAVFKLTVTAHDAIFGTQVTSHALVTKPDGSRYDINLDGTKPSVLPSMVRGLYGLRIDSAVLGGHTNLLVSRDDNVDLRVVTLLDAVLVAAVAFLLLVGALVGGRMMARRRSMTSAGTNV